MFIIFSLFTYLLFIITYEYETSICFARRIQMSLCLSAPSVAVVHAERYLHSLMPKLAAIESNETVFGSHFLEIRALA